MSGERYVTFDGIAKACAAAAGAKEPELVHFNPKAIDLGGKKAFPLRDQHFFTSIDKVLTGTHPSIFLQVDVSRRLPVRHLGTGKPSWQCLCEPVRAA